LPNYGKTMVPLVFSIVPLSLP